MNIKKLNEEIESILEAKEVSNYGTNSIDFDNIGCGIQIETGTSQDEFFTINLEGYSANSGKNIEFKSNSLKVGYGLPIEERKQMNDKFVQEKQQIKAAILQAAKNFDEEIVRIMESFGYSNK